MQSDWRGFMKVVFIYKSGRKRAMAKHYADILKTLGHGDYQVQQVIDRVSLGASAEKLAVVAEANSESETETLSGENLGFGFGENKTGTDVPRVVDLNTLSREQLIALAKERDVKIHGNASDEKIRDALMESAAQGAN